MESKSNNGQSEDYISVNESTNEIHFNASINSKSISTLITKLLQMEEQLLKKTKTLKRKIDKLEEDKEDLSNVIKISVEPQPIKLFITSHGGLVYQVFSAIDTIQGLKVPVHTYCQVLFFYINFYNIIVF